MTFRNFGLSAARKKVNIFIFIILFFIFCAKTSNRIYPLIILVIRLAAVNAQRGGLYFLPQNRLCIINCVFFENYTYTMYVIHVLDHGHGRCAALDA